MKPMYYGIPFSPQATLTDTIGAADTIIKVSDVSAFPDAPNYATIGTDEGGETILYTAKTGKRPLRVHPRRRGLREVLERG